MGTPVGNLDDMVPRAVRVLQSVDLIAVENTRHAAHLLSHFGVRVPTVAFHDHNEKGSAQGIVERLLSGQSIALISDAGTPLISDPGYTLVGEARAQGIRVEVIPGPCAAVMALAGSGLPTDRFTFLGFAPARSSARLKWFEAVLLREETLIVYETPHRIVDCLGDALQVLGDRRAVIARELTKLFESWYCSHLSVLLEQARADSNVARGELVLVIEGRAKSSGEDNQEIEIERVMRHLLSELSVSRAAAMAADLTGFKKNDCYRIGLALSREQ